MGVSVLVLSVRLINGDGDINIVRRTIRVSHNNRNSDLVTRLRILRNLHGDLTSVLINGHTIRNVLTRGELRALRSLGVLAVLVLELRSRNLNILTRLTRTILITRLERSVLVRGLRVLVFLVRDAVVIVIRIRDIRIAITIGVQLELSWSLIRGTVRVGHRDRNLELLNGVLVQLRLIRERNSDLTGVLVNLGFVALRSLEALRNRELRTLRSLRVLTVLILERRRRLGFLTRNNQLLLVRRRVLVCVLGHQDGPCGNVVTTRNEDYVEDIALLSILRDVEGALCNLSLDTLGLVKFASLENVTLRVTPLNLGRQGRQVAVELWGHGGARGSRLIGGVVVSRDRHWGERHDCVVDVVQRV